MGPSAWVQRRIQNGVPEVGSPCPTRHFHWALIRAGTCALILRNFCEGFCENFQKKHGGENFQVKKHGK